MPREEQVLRFRAVAMAIGFGVVGIGFIVFDLSAYLVEESNRKIAQENKRVSACYENPSAKGCEKEAATIKKMEEQLKDEEEKQRQAEAERIENEGKMIPICAVIAMQHYNMGGGNPSSWILSNTTWHDAGCHVYFGHIRENDIRNHPSLPASWQSIDYSDAFPKQCWWVNGGDLQRCSHR
ncbi:MAG: hypothetical protein ACKO50_01260 [Cyanobium sp.]